MTEDLPVALVTGSGKGIGKAIAVALAKKGTFVYINYLSDEKSALKTLDQIREINGTGALMPFDVTSQNSSQDAVKSILQEKKRIDILVNNAGIKDDRLMAMMKKDSWDKVIDANLNSFFNVTKPVIKVMLKKRYGRIINLTSTSGQMGNPGQVNYSASKAGLIGATKALAKEIASRNITVNAVSPGFIETQMTQGLKQETLIEAIPANRLGQPEEVAELVAFLSSDKAGYITGQVIGINGGLI